LHVQDRIFGAGGNHSRRPDVVGAVGRGLGRCALVAADDSEFWFSLRREIPEFEERLLSVRTGRDCLRAIEDPRVRLAVLDSSLGDVSGTQLVHLVRRIRPDLGIVLTFARSDQGQEKEARQAGILYYGDRTGIRAIAQVVKQGLKGGESGDPPVGNDGDPGVGRNPSRRDARPGAEGMGAGDTYGDSGGNRAMGLGR
jgi:DNA-binding NtrC family response regulator